MNVAHFQTVTNSLLKLRRAATWSSDADLLLVVESWKLWRASGHFSLFAWICFTSRGSACFLRLVLRTMRFRLRAATRVTGAPQRRRRCVYWWGVTEVSRGHQLDKRMEILSYEVTTVLLRTQTRIHWETGFSSFTWSPSAPKHTCLFHTWEKIHVVSLILGLTAATVSAPKKRIKQDNTHTHTLRQEGS